MYRERPDKRMDKPQLHGTPLSHFTRKIRILLAELGVDFDFVRASSVLATSPESYAGNPLMRVPTLVHGETTVIDSDHIARYLVTTFDPNDTLRVRSERVPDMNRLAVVSGIMNNVVVLILARRGGLADIEKVAYFRKLTTAIDTALTWLDGDADPDDESFDYRDVATICMWQHLEHYALVPDLARHGRLAARVSRFAARPSVTSTAPAVSLAEATADGWKPA